MTAPRARCALTAVGLMLLTAPGAHATVANGLVAFEGGSFPSRTILTIDPITPSSPLTFFSGLPEDSADPAWSPDGTILAFSSAATGRREVYVVNADGTGRRQVTHDPAAALDPTWSPDGRSLAFTSLRNGAPDIYVTDLDGSDVRRITSDPAVDQQADWAPDGSQIAFESNRSGRFAIWGVAPDGSGGHQVTDGSTEQVEAAWSPDSTTLAFAAGAAGARSLYSVARTGGIVTQLTPAGLPADFPAWSPDGAQLAFSTGAAVETFPVADASKASYLAAGTDPSWAHLPEPAAVPRGDVTVNGEQVSAATPLPSVQANTVIDADQGSILINFRRPGVSDRVPASTVRVTGGTFTVVAKTRNRLTLRLHPLDCPAGGATAARKKRRRSRKSSVEVHHGHVDTIANHTSLSTKGTNYRVVETCRGTFVTVRSGLVYARPTSGPRRVVRLRAGQSALFTAGHRVALVP